MKEGQAQGDKSKGVVPSENLTLRFREMRDFDAKGVAASAANRMTLGNHPGELPYYFNIQQDNPL